MMKPPFRIILLLALSLIVERASATRAAAPADLERIVVMISVDGLANFYFDDPKAEMPTIHRLAAAARGRR